jgi:hypothetical protein
LGASASLRRFFRQEPTDLLGHRLQRTCSLVAPWRRTILNLTIGKSYRLHNPRLPNLSLP